MFQDQKKFLLRFLTYNNVSTTNVKKQKKIAMNKNTFIYFYKKSFSYNPYFKKQTKTKK